MNKRLTKMKEDRTPRRDAGSLALEQVLFIGAVVLLTAGVYAFYQDLGAYFTNFSITAPPTNFGTP